MSVDASSLPSPVRDGAIESPAEVRGFFARIARRYDCTNTVVSLGMDAGWRQRVARQVAARNPRTILDLATGTGTLARTLQEACPDARVAGADVSVPMMLEGKRRGVRIGFVGADALRLPFREASFDAVTVAFGLRNMGDWQAAVREMARVLRPAGQLVVLEFSKPPGLLGVGHGIYLREVLPRVAGWLTGERKAYQYLAASVGEFPPAPVVQGWMRECGLTAPRSAPLSLGVVTIHSGIKATAGS